MINALVRKAGAFLRHQRGFTLLELMVTVSIVAILAGIGMPIYLKQTQRARRVSATTEIMTTVAALQKCFTLNVTYVNPPCTVADTHNTDDGNYTITVTDRSATFFTVTAKPVATGQQKNDACTEFIIDSTNTKKSTSTSSSTTCW